MNKKIKQAPEEEEKETTEEEETEEEAEEETTEEETKEEEKEETTDEEVAEVAEKIVSHLKLDKLQAKIDKIIGKDEMAKKIFISSDVQKEVDSLTKEEIIVGFFGALVRNDKVALKALSEGVASDGGYLFPDEFRKELIRDLAEPTRMRGLVRVIPMKRDIMKIPKLGSRPKLRWTSENAASLLNRLKVCANFQQKTINCWELLKRTISRQAYQIA